MRQLTRTDQLVFRAKSLALIGARSAANLRDGQLYASEKLTDKAREAELLGLDRSALFITTDPREQDLELGKIQNLRVAASALDRTMVQPGAIFSFWRVLGRPTRAKGYVVGRELRQGCLIPTVAGGICQLSNALSRVVEASDVTQVIERHRHSAQVDGLVCDRVTDATVFWNYIDFRFRSDRRLVVLASLSETELIVELRSAA